MSRTETPLHPREVKFAEVLTRLVESSPYRRNRRPIWEALNISSGALSQYMSGQNVPRIDTLVALADFFGVSLDHLVLDRPDRQPAEEDARPFVRYVEWALGDVQSRVSSHDWLVARIGRRIANEIDRVANEINTSERFAGVVNVDDQMILESYSRHVKVLCRELESDLLLDKSGDVDAGRFVHVIAANLRSNNATKYNFLLLPNRPTSHWESLVHTFRRVLVSELGVPNDRLANCRFRLSKNDSFTAAVFYQLDKFVQRNEPLFWEQLRPYADENGWVGFIPKQNKESQGDALYSTERLKPAIKLFNDWWEKANSLSE